MSNRRMVAILIGLIVAGALIGLASTAALLTGAGQ